MSEVSGKTSGDSPQHQRISILIVTYESAGTIHACIDSILADGHDLDLEIILVDNHSSDKTPDILEALAQREPCIQVILNRHNHGFARGNNQALAEASGDYILILNPDTILKPGVLKGLVESLEQSEERAVTAPQMRWPDGRIQKTCRRFPRHSDVLFQSLGLSVLFPHSQRFNAWKMGDFDHKTSRSVDQPAGAALMVRAEILKELGGFDENFPMFFNDVDLCKRIKDQGHEIWFESTCVVDHLGGASVKQRKLKMTLSSHVSFFRYFEKHFTRLHQQPLNFIVGILLYLGLIPRLILLAISGTRTSQKRDNL